jgi:oxygen-independent coproporphyrinogen-3 oxidase
MSELALSAPHWDSSVIAKYDVAGPRYTSYPTALQFSDAFTVADYRQLWPQQAPSIAPLSLYVHIPFCENICYYCACNKIVTRRKEDARQYLDYLEREIRLQSALVGATRPVTQLHWGGGTPTFLSAAEMTELMHALASHFKLLDLPGREYSIEVDPRTVDRQTLALLKGLGFNRLSFGIQDFDEQVQRAINREQSFAQVESLCAAARNYNFDSISFDLIYGLPHQSTSSMQRTLRQVVSLRPERIALYNYAHLPLRFPSQRALSRLSLPAAEEKLAMLASAIDTLCAAGYLYIGMDHFVLPNDELARAQVNGHLQRNFQGYSTCLATDLLSLGISAISSTASGYAQNARDLDTYYRALDANELPIAKGLRLSADDIIRRHVIMQIACNLGVDTRAVEKKFDIIFKDYFNDALAQLQQLQNDGLIVFDDAQLRVTSTGRLLLRNICMAFDRYLPHAAATRYSRSL